ncbi:MAG: M48 family metalloprotease [Armatimonadetes bacterium]|nr:M48 family metalloprotease [Armatimonadota bacterium]
MLRRRHIAALALLLAVAMSLTAGCKPQNIISTSEEVEIGKEAAAKIEKEHPVNKDPQLNRLVTGMGQNLVRYSKRQDIQYTFKILDHDEVNAVSLPGGWIYVYKGLIDATKNEPDQLAGVIAHEIGHVAARHHADMIGRQVFAGVLVQTLTRGDTQQWAGLFANLSLLSWSREHEFEADKLGVNYTFQSKQYAPEGLIGFFAVLEGRAKSNPSKFEQMFRTHPVNSERIKRANEYLAKLKSGAVRP